MSTLILPFALDFSAQGLPPGGTPHTNWAVNGAADYGAAILTAGDSKTISCQITGIAPKSMVRFWANWPDVVELQRLLGLTCDGNPSAQVGVINSVTVTAVHKRAPVTNGDTAAISVLAGIQNPFGVNLTTIWAFDLLDTNFSTAVSPLITAAPDGGPWTVAKLLTTQFGLQLIDGINSGHPYISQYIVDQFFITVDYSVTAAFPVPVVGGGHGCECDLSPGALAGAHGVVV